MAALGQERPLAIINAVIMTASHGTIDKGAVLVRNGKIAAVGKDIAIPADALVIDARGETVTPGIIDAHAHAGLPAWGASQAEQDVNETTGPFQADLQIADSMNADSDELYLLLAAGQTAELQLPGSGEIVGGQAAPIKTKFGRPREEFFIKGAPVLMKTACRDTPAGLFGRKGQEPASPADTTRMRRAAFDQARAYAASWATYRAAVKRGKKDIVPPARDLNLEALNGILDGRILVNIHCHSEQGFRDELAIAKDYGYKIRTFHHASEAYKVAPELAEAGAIALMVVDWWAEAGQAHDNMPWGPGIVHDAGVRLALHGEAPEESRHLNQEAGKLIRYAGFSRDEAIAAVTLNAAYVLGLEDRIGSIDVGKDADLVLWKNDPLSSYGKPQQVFIEGELFFDASLPGRGLPGQGDAR
ncbi:amidohydrolase family protein [Sphingopyxis fribergensis]